MHSKPASSRKLFRSGPPCVREVHNMPIWLPPLPFAVIAITLLCIGIWAWAQGRR